MIELFHVAWDLGLDGEFYVKNDLSGEEYKLTRLMLLGEQI